MTIKIGEYQVVHVPDYSKKLSEVQIGFWKSWIEALRSGKYKQSKGCLHTYTGEADDEEGFCCLGVACDVQQEATRGSWRIFDIDDKKTELGIPHPGNASYGFVIQKEEGKNVVFGSLPRSVAALYGIPAIGITVTLRAKYSPFPAHLSFLNDRLSASFSQIADILECALTGGYVKLISAKD